MLLETVDDPVPRLVLLEIDSLLFGIKAEVWADRTAVIRDSIFRGMRAGKFAALKFIKWRVDFLPGAADIQSLSECIRMGQFPVLSRLWFYFGDCPESTLNSLVTSLECIRDLRSLGLTGAGMARGHKSLLKSMRAGGLRTLEELDLSESAMRNTGCELYGEVVSEGLLEDLRILSLRGDDVEGRGAIALANAFSHRKSRKLCSLDISENAIDDNGMQALAQALTVENFQSLQILKLKKNKIGDVGLKALSHALESGGLSSVEELYLSHNQFGQKGLEALCSAFVQSHELSSVRRLDLSHNQLGDVGLEMLSLALESKRFSSLQELDLSYNLFGDKGLVAWSHALESGKVNGLRILWLKFYSWGTMVTSKGVGAVVAAFAKNPVLVTDVRFEWFDYPELDRRREELMHRNRENARIWAALEGKLVPATFSKIFLCGDPEVGKTTLRKSLQRPVNKSWYIWERSPWKEKRTRGIQTSKFLCKGKKADEETITMVLWDFAGQEEYHLVHNAFYSGLTFAKGLSTIFVIVCDDSQDDQNLKNWLRFIVSSCETQLNNKHRRHVYVVINCKKGCKNPQHDEVYWKDLLEKENKTFARYLDICKQPFRVDVRRCKHVQEFKGCVLQQSRTKLNNQWVPEICMSIQSNLGVWSQEQQQFPVLHWTKFVEKVNKVQIGTKWLESTIEAAAEYLNQAGILIFINRKPQVKWKIPECKLVILDPNSLCNKILGDVFLVPEMTKRSSNLFRHLVSPNKGLISDSDCKQFFRKLVKEDHDYKNLVSIMMHLGVCYKSSEESLAFPSLIRTESTKKCWDEVQADTGSAKEQWVMGFSVVHKKNDMSLASIGLWNRFQVELAGSVEYGQPLQNNFMMSKEFMIFTHQDMIVLIQLNKEEVTQDNTSTNRQKGKEERVSGSPSGTQKKGKLNKELNKKFLTFDGIEICVKPGLSVEGDVCDVRTRRVCQLNLASELVDMLLRLWGNICPEVEYVERVVWPWPATNSSSRPNADEIKERNVEVTYIQQLVKEHGPKKSMEAWKVGSTRVTAGELLSSRHTEYLLQSVEVSNLLLAEKVKEAEVEGVFPQSAVFGANEVGCNGSKMYGGLETAQDGGWQVESTPITSPQGCVSGPLNQTDRLVLNLHRTVDRNHASDRKRWEDLNRKLDNFSEAYKDQMNLLLKIQDVGRIFLEEKDYSCPRFLYLGEEKSGAWKSLKKVISLHQKVHVHFFCEALYDDNGLHPVANQAGIDVTGMRDWVKALAPWLKVSLTVFLITANTVVNVVVPGMGSVMSGFVELLKASGIADGLERGTGYVKSELDNLIGEGSEAEASSSKDRPRELYGRSKKAVTEFLKGRDEEFYTKVGLRKVRLDGKNNDHSSRVAWVCDECYDKYKGKRRVHDL